MDLEIVAHRGFSAMAPENTLAAFSAAIEGGANSIEFDLQLSADGVPVIFHDETLDRITGTSGKVREKSLNELKQLNAGGWFAEQFVGENIPTLASALEIFKRVPNFLYFDVKPHCQWSETEVEGLIQQVKEAGIVEKCIMTAFNEDFLDQVRSCCPEMKLGYFLTEASDYPQQLHKAATAGNAILSSLLDVVLENPHFVEESRTQGVDWVVWTVDRPEHFQQLIDLGVKRIITNSLIGWT
ncbi:MAG: glycerophosphodiester phosphodiesterase family protein [Limnoraphis robusta]|uniref:Glycerophosphodiester phosphodiesterase n=2 Tax=Limnoraphis robusta TaxID=1118279 RepID=A0A0F5YEH7_9CYAN|nr:glycerophosphodiester phosphodiesterase family protein [Limnoraphis robusta]KKD37153.1 glycerophosphodiester phosphodiesterase [Limnoraphis robusta CS-951]MEA5500070.1 glycerophosphodiester phosphodiesterase family protein [Limnoraphis robusta BA-68 BA1]MEA5521216.1 glycerophosphodiester phosphodiesterase family protein [Limnoraphis robusta CCNP1315]MEA5548984.1 glycerophosphodiester phosphodiesterase family protein [Limnoraphis robusta CCNP1324]